MKKVIIIFCALAVIVGCTLTSTPKAAEPKTIGAEVESSQPSTPAPICETIAEPEETTPPIAAIAFVEPVCHEETEIVAIPEPEPIVIEEVPTPTAPPQTASPPIEQVESGTRIVDGQHQLYVPGFGWLENEGGGTIQIIVGSEGSIDKMVGSMGGEATDNCPND